MRKYVVDWKFHLLLCPGPWPQGLDLGLKLETWKLQLETLTWILV